MKDLLVSILQAGESIYVYGEKWGPVTWKNCLLLRLLISADLSTTKRIKDVFLELSLSEIWRFGSLALSLPSTTHNVWYEC